VLKALYGTAISCGARRICLCDTVGHATPHGVRQLVRFVKREIVDPSGEEVKIDWHGHRDRGLASAQLPGRHRGGGAPHPRHRRWESASGAATPRWTCCW
jgi:pyruvate/oxaloacetate carboxyltransferase